MIKRFIAYYKPHKHLFALDMFVAIASSVVGIREVKSFANEEMEISKFGVVNNHFRKAKERMYALMATFFTGMGFITDLYYGTVVAGGQKQRVSIARAFLKNPPVLIFDEAISSLDTESEALIQKSMEQLAINRTTIIIAHRLSTVRNANWIYVLQHGKLIEQGTPESLLELKGYYKNLYTRNLI
ncbi:MAG: ATP-binding cassette domain-containing protein [Candidatus Zophobacter franzmannii]|nr:ATP-binding cassette domain-containing protein [Candidatus Zophobacter franzmannii]